MDGDRGGAQSRNARLFFEDWYTGASTRNVIKVQYLSIVFMHNDYIEFAGCLDGEYIWCTCCVPRKTFDDMEGQFLFEIFRFAH
jgi:hypothetical protein